MLSIPFIVVVKCNKVPKFNKISILIYFNWKEKSGKYVAVLFVKLARVY